jgi:hypothetical protein
MADYQSCFMAGPTNIMKILYKRGCISKKTTQFDIFTNLHIKKKVNDNCTVISCSTVSNKESGYVLYLETSTCIYTSGTIDNLEALIKENCYQNILTYVGKSIINITRDSGGPLILPKIPRL